MESDLESLHESTSSPASALSESSELCVEGVEGAEATAEPYQYEPLADSSPSSNDGDGTR